MLTMGLREVIGGIKSGKISAKEVCEKCINRMVKVRKLNAFITETPDVCRSQLQCLETESALHENRELAGLPIAVKDNFCTQNVRTSCASRMLDNFIPPYTATVVQRLYDEGGILVGKTNMDEFAMGVVQAECVKKQHKDTVFPRFRCCGSTDGAYGPVFNPWKFKFKHECDAKTDQNNISNTTERHVLQVTERKNSHKSDISDTITNDRLDELFISGGSSGGSAVAVATGCCFGALGSDTGGSTRNPASFCGVVGLKPTYGLVSRYGLIPLVNSLDVPGILARTVDDASVILNTIAGHDRNDSTTVRDPFTAQNLDTDFSVKNLHVGIPKEYHAPGLSTEVQQAWSAAADMFEKAGAKVTPVSLPHTKYSIVTYSVLCACEVASNMARYDGVEFGHRANNSRSTEDMFAQSRHEGFNDVVRGRIFAGNYFLLRENYEKHFLHALKVRRLISNDFKDVFQSGVDVLLTPTTLTDAPLYRWFVEADNRTRTSVQDVFTQPINMAGVPAVSIPFKLSTQGLPIGLQLIGQNFKDQHLLNVARWLEKEANFKSLDLSFLDHNI